MSWEKVPWMAMLKSTELKLWVDISLSALRSFFIFLNGPLLDVLLLMRFCDKFSPHKLDPPCVYGIFSSAIPCNEIPFKSNRMPSHVSSTYSWRFLQVAENVSLVAYSKYQSLFFIRELNLWGFFSRSRWNLTQIAASTPTVEYWFGCSYSLMWTHATVVVIKMCKLMKGMAWDGHFLKSL